MDISSDKKNARIRSGYSRVCTSKYSYIHRHQNPGQPLSLDHVAVFIDADLYFEKSGAGDDTPFRLIDWRGLAADWMTSVFNYDWRRRVAGAVWPTQAPSFGLQSPQLVAQFPLLAALKPSVAQQFCMAPDVENGRVFANTYLWMVELPPFRLDRFFFSPLCTHLSIDYWKRSKGE